MELAEVFFSVAEKPAVPGSSEPDANWDLVGVTTEGGAVIEDQVTLTTTIHLLDPPRQGLTDVRWVMLRHEDGDGLVGQVLSDEAPRLIEFSYPPPHRLVQVVLRDVMTLDGAPVLRPTIEHRDWQGNAVRTTSPR